MDGKRADGRSRIIIPFRSLQGLMRIIGGFYVVGSAELWLLSEIFSNIIILMTKVAGWLHCLDIPR